MATEKQNTEHKNPSFSQNPLNLETPVSALPRVPDDGLILQMLAIWFFFVTFWLSLFYSIYIMSCFAVDSCIVRTCAYDAMYFCTSFCGNFYAVKWTWLINFWLTYFPYLWIYNVQDSSVLYNNVVLPVMFESWQFTHIWKTPSWSQHFIKRGSLCHFLLKCMHQSIQDSARSWIYVLMV